jgi:adenine-specific DNA-methyltransferase
MGNLLESLIDLLKKDERFVSGGNLLKNMVIESAIKLDSNLLKLLLSEEKMKEKAFLSYKVDIKAFDDNAKDFDDLSIDNQKKFLYECLDKNHLYVNYSEIDDEEYRVKEEDKKMNKEFYENK